MSAPAYTSNRIDSICFQAVANPRGFSFFACTVMWGCRQRGRLTDLSCIERGRIRQRYRAMYHRENVDRFVLHQVDQTIRVLDYFTDSFSVCTRVPFLQRKEIEKSAWFYWSTDQPQKLRNEENPELCERGFQRDPGLHCESIRHASFWQAETFSDIRNRDGIAICHVLKSVFDLLSDVDSIHDIVP